MFSGLMGGGDSELREKAKHRGRAYQCLRCYHKEGKSMIDVKCRMEEHVLKVHLRLDEVPFYCKLCLFRCTRKDQLLHHVTAYRRHVEMAARRGVTNHSECLVQNSTHHTIGNLDYTVLSAEESIGYFMAQSKATEAPKITSPSTLQSLQQSVTVQQPGTQQDLTAATLMLKSPLAAQMPFWSTVQCRTPQTDPASSESKTATPRFTCTPLPSTPVIQIGPSQDPVIAVDNWAKQQVSGLPTATLQQLTQLLSSTPMEQMLSSCVATRVEPEVIIKDVPTSPQDTSLDFGGLDVEEAAPENLMPQLLPEEDMTLSTPTTKRKGGEDQEEVVPQKKAKAADASVRSEPVFNVDQVAVNSMVAALHGLTEAVERSNRVAERVEKTMIENTCVMSKMVDAVTRLRTTVDEHEKEERRREDRSKEQQRKQEEEKRRERGEERRRDEQRRETDRKDREDRKRTEEKTKDEDRRKDKREKENRPTVKSALGRSHTENEGGRKN